MRINAEELWRQIPPEEKLTLMANAHSRGVAAGAAVIGIASTLAVGFHCEALMWISFVISPLVFQFAAGKAWRDQKPKLMLRYLAAHSAARRYAFIAMSKELVLSCIFRGTLEEIFERDQVDSALEARAKGDSRSEVWVILFVDSVVIIKEAVGGAELKFAHLLNDKLSVRGESPSGEEYSTDHEVHFTYTPRGSEVQKHIKLTSSHPAALIVFEKKLLQLQKEEIARRLEETGLIDVPPLEEDFITSFDHAAE